MKHTILLDEEDRQLLVLSLALTALLRPGHEQLHGKIPARRFPSGPMFSEFLCANADQTQPHHPKHSVASLANPASPPDSPTSEPLSRKSGSGLGPGV